MTDKTLRDEIEGIISGRGYGNCVCEHESEHCGFDDLVDAILTAISEALPKDMKLRQHEEDKPSLKLQVKAFNQCLSEVKKKLGVG